MSTSRKIAPLSASIIATKGSGTPSTGTPEPKKEKDDNGERIAVTVRLAPNTYKRLKMYGLENRKSNQDIFLEALEAYLRQDVQT